MKNLDVAYFTSCGPNRRRNEDALLLHDRVIQIETMKSAETIQFNKTHLILGIGDGLGGAPGGDLASDIVLKSLSSMPHLIENKTTSASTVHNLLKIMQQIVIDEPDLEGFGTVATFIGIQPNKINILHIGDTRFYHLKKIFPTIRMIPLTEDHTLAYNLFKKKQISRNEIEKHPQRNLLTSCICGYKDMKNINWFYRSFNPHSGRYLLASDGLWENLIYLKDRKMLLNPDLKMSANFLLDSVALLNPRDNYSFLLFDL